LTTVAISQGKALTAARYKRPSRAIDSSVAAGRVQMMAFPGVMPVEGGVPIIVNGKYVGGVGASGATSAQDAQVAKAGADTVKP
jgi:glc operon protein GlcG